MSPDRKIDVSVIIVTYNNHDEINTCLTALLSEVNKYNHEIILVDNHSVDSTPDVVRQFTENSPRARIKLFINERNLGFTRAVNQGLEQSRGEVVLLLNPDTVVQPGSLTRLLKELRADAEIGMIAPQLLNTDGSIQPSCRRFPRRRDVLFEILGLSSVFRRSRLFNGWKMGDFDHKQRRPVDQPQGACQLFHRRLLNEVGFWDESFPMFFSDVDWCKRVRDRGYKIIFEPEARVLHHRGRSVMPNRPAMIWTSHLSFYRYFRKHRANFGLLNELVGSLLLLTAVLRIAAALFRTAVTRRED